MPTTKPDFAFAPGIEDYRHEWDKFPPSVKRKYFSSLERLRLAQASNPRPKSSSSKSYHVMKGSANTSIKGPRPILTRRHSSHFKSPSLRRSRKTPSPTCDEVSPSDAQWFLRLPDKVRQLHFTREERLLLSGQSEAFIPDAADERVLRSFYQQGREANRSVPTLSTSSDSSASTRDTLESEASIVPCADMDDSAFDGFRWIENDDDHDLASTLHLDDYHEFINQSAEPNPAPSKRRPSFRRTLSLTSLPFGSNQMKAVNASAVNASAAPSTPASPPPDILRTQKPKTSRPHLNPIHRARRTSTGSCNLEPSAIHYTDPNARLKLRVYLASPQKFDEAIEFGFPSMDEKENIPPISRSRPSLKRKADTAPCTTFLYDDNHSLYDAFDDDDNGLDDDDDISDTVSLPERSGPYTPMDLHFPDTYLLPPSEATSTGGFGRDSGCGVSGGDGHTEAKMPIPSFTDISDMCSSTNMSDPNAGTTLFPRANIRHNFDKDDPYVQALSGCGREMTLHMTLTRPDLRGDDISRMVSGAGKPLYVVRPRPSPSSIRTGAGAGGYNDPLALEHLPISDGECGDIWDTLPLPKEGGVLRRVWRKVSGKAV